jgi:hypothetical protein
MREPQKNAKIKVCGRDKRVVYTRGMSILPRERNAGIGIFRGLHDKMAFVFAAAFYLDRRKRYFISEPLITRHYEARIARRAMTQRPVRSTG